MSKAQKNVKDVSKKQVSPFQEYWSKNNYLVLFLGIGILILGYFLMSQAPWDGFSSLTLSPLVLLVAYLVILPVAIMIKSSFFKK